MMELCKKFSVFTAKYNHYFMWGAIICKNIEQWMLSITTGELTNCDNGEMFLCPGSSSFCVVGSITVS